jgi:hypothetical protein
MSHRPDLCPVCGAPLDREVDRHIGLCMLIEARGRKNRRLVVLPRSPEEIRAELEREVTPPATDERPFPFSL